MLRFACLLSLLFGSVFRSQAAAERFDVFDVFVGHDGLISAGSWFPVVCEIQNEGPSFNGVFELRGVYEEQVRLAPMELPTGTRKRVVIPVFSPGQNSTREWQARLLDERGRMRAEGVVRQVRRRYPREVPLVGALSRTVAGRPVFPTQAENTRGAFQVEAARLVPDLFPDSPIALEGLQAIYLSTAQATEDRLRVNQVNALLAWLNAGGHLIVGVEQLAQLNGAPWLRQMLPCEFDRTVTVNPAALHTWLAGSQRLDGTSYEPELNRRTRPNQPPVENPFGALPRDSVFEAAPLTVAAGKLFDGQVVAGTGTEPLVITARRGRGRLTVLTFTPEIEPVMSWKHRPYFWAKLADLPLDVIPPNVQPERYTAYSVDGVFGAMLESRQVRKLPVGWLLLLLVGYLVVIGPLDRWWLKKINRPMLTWLTFPGYVVFFSLLIYFIGYKLRAGESEWNELHVVDVLPWRTQAELHGRTFSTIYSPGNAHYALACNLPFAALRGELLGRYQGGQEASQANLRHTGNTFSADIYVPVWTSQLYVNDWWDSAPLPFTAQVERQASGYQVRIENRQEQPLTEVRLVVADAVFDLGTVPAGQTRTFPVAAERGTNLSTFVTSHGSMFREAINRRQHAFGENQVSFPSLPASSMAASFISALNDPDKPNNSFLAVPGFDLTALVARGDAAVLAWSPNYAPVAPIHQFAPRRQSRHTLWRTTCPVQ